MNAWTHLGSRPRPRCPAILRAVFVLGLALALAAACSHMGQNPPGQTPLGPRLELTGKIAFMEKIGGYYLMAENPPGEYAIDNQNQAVLEGLFKSQKTVTVVGRTTISADHLFVEKIDGKTYTAK